MNHTKTQQSVAFKTSWALTSETTNSVYTSLIAAAVVLSKQTLIDVYNTG